LALLRLVLRAGLRSGNHATLSRSALHGKVFKPALQRTADALHALLSVVPDASPQTLETGGKPSQVPIVPFGHRSRILELLCLVS
jgi:hypothetical protein